MNRPELFDLHVHSSRSDGLRSVFELAHLAALSGLAGIAVTDHDTLPDLEILSAAAERRGVAVIPALELSTQGYGRKFHLLGYFIDPQSPPLRALVDGLLSQRRARWDALVEQIGKRGVRWDESALRRIRDQSAPGRKHLARELVRLRRSTSSRAAFERFLSIPDGEIPPLGVDLDQAIAAIHDAGGAAILAHPPTGMTEETWKRLAATGLDGIETRFGKLAGGHRRFLDDRAAEHGWIGTAGSDYHGDGDRARLGIHTTTRAVIDELARRSTCAS